MNGLGVVVIGRNEGERLRRCLDALVGVGPTIVYVDSGSTDESLTLAAAHGVTVVELDMASPFTAARARNAGFERLSQIHPGIRCVQFLDGDCEVIDGWLERAHAALSVQPEAAIVFGKLHERFPERSIYNRLAEIEWIAQSERGAGDAGTLTCGGVAMIRAAAFRAVGGFNPSVPAGEEAELCQRLHRAGWSIVRLDVAMARHDSAILRFRQWARRQIRTGYGGLDFVTRFGRGNDRSFRRQILSARTWSLGWLLALIAGGLLAAMLAGSIAGWTVAGLLMLTLPAQIVRIAMKNRIRAGGLRAALVYAMLMMIEKWLHLVGQLLYLLDRLSGRHARLIEYKLTVSGARRATSSP